MNPDSSQKFGSSSITTSVKVRVACITGDLEGLKGLVAQDPTIVNTPFEYGKTALSIAASWGHTPICEFLLEKGANVNHSDDIGWTPLHWAAFTGSIDTCKSLLHRGADSTMENKAHQTPLDFDKAEQLRNETN
ncbi:putative Ankyrin repeats (3 copies) [Blattamonas nauphoetae]|uniref:Ankyrin repeats (3 copies) n=1 Tax=Blattamonas nauphoetae TaxID=2049346 RepID=A0ABQ9X3V6_9EUKA|nr:putative Ankyrin repeats (3 copies) [Blattamonas nauphoetae]